MSQLNDTPKSTETEEPKKISLAEAAKQMLAQKKQAQNQAKTQGGHQENGGPMMKSQLTKKPNNQRRRMGV